MSVVDMMQAVADQYFGENHYHIVNYNPIFDTAEVECTFHQQMITVPNARSMNLSVPEHLPNEWCDQCMLNPMRFARIKPYFTAHLPQFELCDVLPDDQQIICRCQQCAQLFPVLYTADDTIDDLAIACPNTKCPSYQQKPRRNTPKGEMLVLTYLKQHPKIKFTYQKTFPGLKDQRALSYDFYLPEAKIVIEYDGQQHYQSVGFFGGDAAQDKQRYHDQLKRDYAREHDLQFVAIPYEVDTQDKVTHLLDEVLSGVPGF